MGPPVFSFDTTADDVIRGVDLAGTTAVVTGASGGLGLETARALGSAGATLVLPVRDPAAFSASDGYARLAVPTQRVDLVALDLVSLRSVRRAAAQIGARHPVIDILVNNAGVMFTPHRTTDDGFEFQFGINHLGHFLLTTQLLPQLRAAAARGGARVVNVTSDAHKYFGPIDLTDINFERRGYDPFSAYGQSKSANVLLTVELQRRFGRDGITALVVHPGNIVTTRLARYMDRSTIKKLIDMGGDAFAPQNIKSDAQGAATTVWAATASSLREHGGAYLADCQLAESTPEATDPDTARRLWESSERWVSTALIATGPGAPPSRATPKRSTAAAAARGTQPLPRGRRRNP
jgi:NAD(P)-dependent dehydrogenase (short-subunit alcohol dehydrogenase family)